LDDLIDFKEINESLQRLSTISTKSLKNLNNEELKDYNFLTNNISRLYGTDGYNLLYKEILNHFPDNTNVIPGSVAGYFIGCKATTNFKYGDECSILHLTGAPFFQDNGEQKLCSKTVYLAPYDNGYSFSELTIGEKENTTAIIYITPPFRGFSHDEINELKAKNIENVIVSYYNENGNQYIVSNVTQTSELPIRMEEKLSSERKLIKSETDCSKNNKGSCNTSTIIGIIFILLIIAIIVYLGYRYSKK
jgi:hypothetical protein